MFPIVVVLEHVGITSMYTYMHAHIHIHTHMLIFIYTYLSSAHWSRSSISGVWRSAIGVVFTVESMFDIGYAQILHPQANVENNVCFGYFVFITSYDLVVCGPYLCMPHQPPAPRRSRAVSRVGRLRSRDREAC